MNISVLSRQFYFNILSEICLYVFNYNIILEHIIGSFIRDRLLNDYLLLGTDYLLSVFLNLTLDHE